MEYYEDAIRNLKNAKSEQVASALLINTAEKLQNGISQQWINQFLHDPDLREKGRHQVVKYLSDAATIRNDDFVVGKFSPCEAGGQMVISQMVISNGDSKIRW